MHDNFGGSYSSQDILREAIDAAIGSLGGPIHKTISWYMDSRGVYSNQKKIDINFFYSNLQELLGPGADMIMEETWEHLQKHYGGRIKREGDAEKCSPLERIQKIMEISGA